MGLGANLGDRTGQIKTALGFLGVLPQTRLSAVSTFYRTQPVGPAEQDWFVNAAALIETGLSPREALEALLGIEQEMGRFRTEKWGPRLIDLDLLFYGRRVIDEPGLVVPHPHLDQRRFVLTPLAEIAPWWEHPQTGLRPSEMLALVPEEGQEVIRL